MPRRLCLSRPNETEIPGTHWRPSLKAHTEPLQGYDPSPHVIAVCAWHDGVFACIDNAITATPAVRSEPLHSAGQGQQPASDGRHVRTSRNKSAHRQSILRGEGPSPKKLVMPVREEREEIVTPRADTLSLRRALLTSRGSQRLVRSWLPLGGRRARGELLGSRK